MKWGSSGSWDIGEQQEQKGSTENINSNTYPNGMFTSVLKGNILSTGQQTAKDTDSIDALKAAVRVVQGEMNV